MTRRRYAEIERKIDRLKEIAEDCDADLRPDPLPPEDKAYLNELFDVDPWDANLETEAAVRNLHRQGEDD